MDELTIQEVSYGISKAGMDAYIDALQLDVEQPIRDVLNDTTSLKKAVESGWQGKSKDAFLKLLDNSVKELDKEIEAEFDNLASKLTELKKQYYDIDKDIIIE